MVVPATRHVNAKCLQLGHDLMGEVDGVCPQGKRVIERGPEVEHRDGRLIGTAQQSGEPRHPSLGSTEWTYPPMR